MKLTISSADISGVPGTATVHIEVRELKRMAEHNVCFSPTSICDIHHCDPQF